MNAPYRKSLRLLLLSGLLLTLTACNTAPKRDLNYAPVRPKIPPAAQQDSGSIYQAGYEMALFEDQRARRVGDVLIVRLQEQTNATKSAKTDATKTTAMSVTNPTLYGLSPKIQPFPSMRTGDFSFALNSDHSFEGEGNSSQKNNLTGTVSVTVTEVWPNGNMVVRGEKRVKLNQGNEYIRLAGIVRPMDIAPDNSVLSTRIVDPTIIYEGDGTLADSNALGWFAGFFLSPLFPF